MDAYLRSLNEMLTRAYYSISKIEELMLRKLSNNSLSIREMRTLEIVGGYPGEGVTITDLALDLGIKPPSVTVMVKRLEKKGYITKDRSGEDGRRVHILLTRDGRRAETAHRYFHRKMVRAIVEDLSPSEREAIATGLVKMNAFLETGIKECGIGKEEET